MFKDIDEGSLLNIGPMERLDFFRKLWLLKQTLSEFFKLLFLSVEQT